MALFYQGDGLDDGVQVFQVVKRAIQGLQQPHQRYYILLYRLM